MTTTPERAPLLVCHNLEVSYGNALQVLRGVSLTLNAGERACVLGPNGAGKTTLMRTIMGLIDNQPERGEVRLDGARCDRWDTGRRVQAGVACVPEGREVFEGLTVRENLTMGAWVAPASSIDEGLASVYRHFPRLAERSGQDAGTLSGGEQQMLAIGRALMSRPRVLLLDEPSLGLAPKITESIFEILAQLSAEGITLLLVEQNARMALRFSERGYVLEGGRVVLSGTAEELQQNTDVQEFYLGVRQTASVKGYQRYKRRRRWA